jgi:hypothetical protein
MATTVVVNSGNPPSAGTTFSVVVTVDSNVSQNTGVSIATTTGQSLTGTATGTITTGNNSVTLNGLSLTVARTGVVIRATQTSGDVFPSGDSPSFTVTPGTTNRVDTTALGFPIINTDFSIRIVSTDGFDNIAVVSQNTVVALTKGSGTGVLSGTLSGTILANASSAIIAGVRYNTAESGVTLVGTSSSGDSIGPLGVNNSFTVYATGAAETCWVTRHRKFTNKR